MSSFAAFLILSALWVGWGVRRSLPQRRARELDRMARINEAEVARSIKRP